MFAEWLTELRQTVFLLNYQFMINDTTQEQLEGRDAQDSYEHGSPVSSHSTLPAPPHVQQPQPFVFFMEASVHRHDQINHWLLVINSTSIPLSPPRRWEVKVGVGPKIPTL